jgi:exodeoxyribonuclease V alpha subunit
MLRWPDVAKLARLTDHQRSAVATTFAGRVGILTGGPGVGKTFTAASVIRGIADEQGLDSVAIAAPTGKAAVRCTSMLQQYGIGLEARTIHRLLAVGRNGHDGRGWGFQYNAQNPLPFQFVIVDETSMVDTSLAANLFDALHPTTHVLLIGDPFQLPPVGHGAPLRDLIAAGVPCGELTEIKRNAGDIVFGCRKIKEGERFEPRMALDLPAGHNWKHIESPSATTTLRHLQFLLQSPPGGINPTWDIQVLVAVNEKSELSRKNVNSLMQGWLNPHGQGLKNGPPFRVGDKIICTSNTWLPIPDLDDEAVPPVPKSPLRESELKEFVANGDLGKVLAIEPKRMLVEFQSPPRLCLVPFVGQGESESQGSKFDLGYALTCHKAQGSQAPIVIALIDEFSGANFVTSMEWWRTAVSRAEKICLTIGQWSVFQRQCRRLSLRDRKTFLRERLEART